MTIRTLNGRVARLEDAATPDDWRIYAGRPLHEWPGAAFVACFEAGDRFDAEALAALARITDAELREMIATQEIAQ